MVGRDALWWEECCVFGGHGRDPGVVVGAVLCSVAMVDPGVL